MKQFNCKTGSFGRLIEGGKKKKRTGPPRDLFGHSLHALSTVWTRRFDMWGWAERLLPVPSLMMRARPSVSDDFRLDCSVDADWTDASRAAVTTEKNDSDSLVSMCWRSRALTG